MNEETQAVEEQVGENLEQSAGSEESDAETSEETGKTSVEESGEEGQSEAEQSEEGKTIPYTRFKEYVDKYHEVEGQLKQMQEQYASMQATFERFKSNPEVNKLMEGKNIDPQTQEALDTLGKMGIKTADAVKEEVMREFENKQAMMTFQSKVTELAEKYNGKDGRPKFDVDAVASYLEKLQIPVETLVRNPQFIEDTYKVINESALVDWAAKQKKKGVYSERGGAPMQTAGSNHEELLKKARESGKEADWINVIKSRVEIPT